MTGRADPVGERGEGVAGAESDLEDPLAGSGIEQPQAGGAGAAFEGRFDQVVPGGEPVVSGARLRRGAWHARHS